MRGLLAAMLVGAAFAARADSLTLYTALDTHEAKIYLDAFEADTGVEVRMVRLSAGEILTRVRAEGGRPQASVWYGGPSLDFMIAARDGLLEPYTPASYTAFPAGAFDPQHRWHGFYLGLIGFASNPGVLARRGAKPPTSWADLLAPGLEGEVSMAYAYTSGTSYTVIASLVQLMGEGPALAYLKSLDGQVHHYNRSGAACVTQVGLGEIGTCVAFSHDILSKGVRKGYPVVLTFPSEGTGYEVGGIALIKDGPEPKAARAFVEWALGVRAQSLLSQWNRLPIRDDAPVAAGVPRPSEVKRIDFDAVKAAEDRRRVIDLWRDETGQ